MSTRRFNLRPHHLFGFKYPKLLLLLITVFLSYFIFSRYDFSVWFDALGISPYAAIFIAGILFPFGFTAPFSIGLFLTLPTPSLLVASLIAGAGAVLSDLFIFSFIRLSLMDEFEELEHTETFKTLRYLIDTEFSAKMRNYLLYIFAGLVIASPLPDELGVPMVAGLTSLHKGGFILLSFILHSAGIFALLYAHLFF